MGYLYLFFISDDLTILQVNRTEEKPCVLHKTFGKLNVCRNSIVTMALPQESRKIVVKYLVNQAAWYAALPVDCEAVGRRRSVLQ